MALYEGLRSSQERPAPEPAWKELRHERAGSRSSGTFLDNLLGQGSRKTLTSVLRSPAKTLLPSLGGAPGRRPGEGAPDGGPHTWRPKRVEAVGSGQSPIPRGKKGVGRAVLILLALGWGLLRWHPWGRPGGSLEAATRPSAPARAKAPSEGGWTQDLASLFRPSNEAERAKLEATEALESRKQDAAEAVRLAALPVVPAGGTALALWQDGAGRWWQVNGKGELRPTAGPAAKDSLGLPELRGVSAAAQEHGQGKRLSLNLPSGLLKTLLPLEPSVASEVRALLLDDPAQPALLTHDGTRCLLDAADWERRQRRLGLVLADLAAKKRRASLIDLRYEDTAVVRPAGRV